MKENVIKLVALFIAVFIVVAAFGAIVAWSWNGFFPHALGLPYLDYGNAVSLIIFISAMYALFRKHEFSTIK